MQSAGKQLRSIWPGDDRARVHIIDQTLLPHELTIVTISTLSGAARAIETMQVRGAPLIGVTAAYGVALAMRADPSNANLNAAMSRLAATRPTAINLRFALDAMCEHLLTLPESSRAEAAFDRASALAVEDAKLCHDIGVHGLGLIQDLAKNKKIGEPVNILTHCNAGWLATADWGTATAPMYMAHDEGIALHVWVDETRPRNQGAALTAWELDQRGVPCTIVADNAAGYLMHAGKVDLVIVGTDRTTASGDVCNKIGTYLKALAARDNGVPFYAAVPSPSIDFSLESGAKIPIETRAAREVTHMSGLSAAGRRETIAVARPGANAFNPAFDVTPARLVTGLITERGVVAASREALAQAFPERSGHAPLMPAASRAARF
ncbi:MAG: S-methyl-5-thioribose-1-phosphate isomerase [Methylocapsa sp.]|nr:S-methyl-5-thioribose-1-phosphate isomerase [Methylocapsa sp.]